MLCSTGTILEYRITIMKDTDIGGKARGKEPTRKTKT
jgi:hypothetical protein